MNGADRLPDTRVARNARIARAGMLAEALSLGMTLPYRISATYCHGELVYDGTTVLAAPGAGRFVRPPASLPLSGAIT